MTKKPAPRSWRRRLFGARPRPFFLELELAVGLSWMVLALVVLFLEQRVILTSQEAEWRTEEADLRLARSVAGAVADSLGTGEVGVPARGSGEEPHLAALAHSARLRSIELRSRSAPDFWVASIRPALDRQRTRIPPEIVASGWAYQDSAGPAGTVLWYSMGSYGHPDLALRLEWSGHPPSAFRENLRWIVFGAPAVVIALGLIQFLFVGRVGRRLDRMVRQALDSDLAPRIGGVVDETDLVESTLRRTVVELERRGAELERLLHAERDEAGELQTVSAALRTNMPGGLLTVEGSGVIRDLNRRGQRLLGVGAEVIGRPVSEVLSSQRAVLEIARRALGGQETVVREEVELVGGDGSTRLRVTAVPLLGREGRFVGILVFLVDVTALRELERKLRVRDTMASLGEISAGLAHELRNSISAAVGFLRLARQDVGAGRAADVSRHFERIREELRYLEKTTDEFLEFSRSDPVEIGPVDLDAIRGELSADLETRHPGIVVRWEASGLRVLGEPTRIRQILGNLLANSSQELLASRVEVPEIRVRAARRGSGMVELVVEDNGRGAPDDLIERMFLPFVSGRAEGTGLGLSLVRRYALALGGDVRYEQAESGGARFLVELPEARSGTVGPGLLPRERDG